MGGHPAQAQYAQPPQYAHYEQARTAYQNPYAAQPPQPRAQGQMQYADPRAQSMPQQNQNPNQPQNAQSVQSAYTSPATPNPNTPAMYYPTASQPMAPSYPYYQAYYPTAAVAAYPGAPQTAQTAPTASYPHNYVTTQRPQSMPPTQSSISTAQTAPIQSTNG